MRTKIRHVDLHPDEFLAAVAGEMSPAELGVYWMVCLLCYARGGNIADDPDWIRAKFRPGRGNRVVGDILEGLILGGKVVRDGDEIGVRRVRDELEIALRRIRDAHENGSRGGRKSNNTNAVEKPNPSFRENLRARNHQPPGKEEGFSPQALNPDFLPPRDGSPPLPSQGDGGAPLRASTKEREPSSDDLISPAEKAAALAELHRALDAVRDKAATGAANSNEYPRRVQ